ncbi:hypothetical protein BDV38DRAFT_276117 [Aspergillus pseudotamarii]|uniref:Uncharacterized protein n=1 Tax=Aspergillus pseudotamarii TaxID=132259 RepID=A0A5N6S9C3_ASPPS|nr:uncharacterized protein BDV38DRAFT_276117 [Aspergillus pseudotamarii]KAE8131252.1 hypothetical protein BDV38DRAFT_276117 [Aspergillus pseudotamarii]
MATQLEFSALRDAMKGLQTTEGYDVLVSYSEEKINQFLRARSEELKSVLEIGPLRTSVKFFGRKYDVDIYMSLDHPLLQFADDRGNIVLKYNIQKAHYEDIKTKDTTTFPAGMVLSFDTKFANATGTVESSQSKDGFAGSGKTASANELVIINPNEKNVSQGVCITFEKASVDLIGTTDASKEAVQDNLFVLGALKKYFQANAELKYYVAGVSNEYKPESGSHSLQPRSFSFSTLKGNTPKDKSALCMWISVKEGTNRDQSSNKDFTSIFHATGLIPIPSGRSCSIIMHNDLVAKQFFMSGLSTGFKNMSSNGELKFSGNMVADDVVVPARPRTNPVKMDGITFSPSKPVTSISFSSDINSKAHKISYTSDEQHVDWSYYTTTVGMNGERWMVEHHGTTNLVFGWTATGSWKDRKTTGHPNMLGLEWTGDKDWTITKSAKDQEWWEVITGGSTNIPENLQNLTVPRPNVDLEMNTLDYFLTTNLLYPGKHIFNADDPSSASTDKGLALPHDLILTGETKIN